MLRFALEQGRILSDELRENIGELDRILAKQGFEPISSIPITLVTVQTTSSSSEKPEGATRSVSLGVLVLKIHAGLCRVVTPATALTLQASEPLSGKRRLLGGMPLLVRGAAITAAICALGFRATSIIPAAKEADRVNPTPTNGPAVSPSPATTPNS
jgi:hypothetical protein